MNIACVWRGDKYDEIYPRNLRRMLQRWAPICPFFCLTDRSEWTPVDERISLLAGWPGWWAKMELFAPWNARLRPLLYFDLDTVIDGSIDILLKMDRSEFAALDDFYFPELCNSSVMIIPKETGDIWSEWDKDPSTHMQKHRSGGDQAFLTPFVRKRIDWSIVKSYKAHRLTGWPDAGQSVVCFHGQPKPHQLDNDPATKAIWLGIECRKSI